MLQINNRLISGYWPLLLVIDDVQEKQEEILVLNNELSSVKVKYDAIHDKLTSKQIYFDEVHSKGEDKSRHLAQIKLWEFENFIIKHILRDYCTLNLLKTPV